MDDDGFASSSNNKGSTDKTELPENKTLASNSSQKISGTACMDTTVVLGSVVVRIQDSLGEL